MAQIIKHRRGSISSIGSITVNPGELIIGSGSLDTLTGPVAFIGDPSSSTYKAIPQLYQGATTPNIAGAEYLNGVQFYSTDDKAIYILDAAGNQHLDLAGNVSGSDLNVTSVTGSFKGNLDGTAATASYVNTLYQDVVISGSLGVNTTTGNSFNINADVFVFTGSFSTSGSVSFAGLQEVSASYVVGYDPITGLLTYESTASAALSASYAVNADTASYVLPLTQDVLITGSLNVTNDITASTVWATSNGSGSNFRVGDDAWIGDINVANTMQVKGQEDETQGYIAFGQYDTITSPLYINTVGSDGTNLNLYSNHNVNISASSDLLFTADNQTRIGQTDNSSHFYSENNYSEVYGSSEVDLYSNNDVYVYTQGTSGSVYIDAENGGQTYIQTFGGAGNLNVLNGTNELNINGNTHITGALSIASPSGTVLDVNADTFIFTGSVELSGSVAFAGLTEISASYLIGYDPITGLISYESTASAAYSASYAVSSSYALHADTASYAYDFTVQDILYVPTINDLNNSGVYINSNNYSELSYNNEESYIYVSEGGVETLTNSGNISFYNNNATGSIELYSAGNIILSGSTSISGSLFVNEIYPTSGNSANRIFTENTNPSFGPTGSIVISTSINPLVLSAGYGTSQVQITGSLVLDSTYGATGSLFGTASHATIADTASYVDAANVYGLNLSQITSGSATASISPNLGLVVNTDISGSNSGSFLDLYIANNATINGNLIVNGTSTIVNSTTVEIGDNIISLNGTGGAYGGIQVKDPTDPSTVSGSLLWDSANDYWIAGPVGSELRVVRQASGTNLTQYALTYADASGSLASLPDPTTITSTVVSGFPGFDTATNTWYMTDTIDGGTF